MPKGPYPTTIKQPSFYSSLLKLRNFSLKMSWGWIIVVLMGFLPLLLVVLTGGGSKNRQQQRQRQQRQQQGLNDRNDNENENDEQRTNTANQQLQRNKRGKNKAHVYSGWRVIVTADCFLSRVDDDVNSSVDALNERIVILRTQLATLQKLAQECELYIVTQVQSDEQERMIVECMKSSSSSSSSSSQDGLSLCDYGLNEHKILFCETARGQIAIARQLEPNLFVGTDPGVTTELNRFLSNVSRVTPTCSFIDSDSDSNASVPTTKGQHVYNTLNALFDSLDK